MSHQEPSDSQSLNNALISPVLPTKVPTIWFSFFPYLLHCVWLILPSNNYSFLAHVVLGVSPIEANQS